MKLVNVSAPSHLPPPRQKPLAAPSHLCHCGRRATWRPSPPFVTKHPHPPASLRTAMLIQISHYQFSLREPYEPGAVLGPDEAKVLNTARAERVKKILSRLVERHAANGGRELLEPEQLSLLMFEAKEIDDKFSFTTHAGKGPHGPKGGLAKEVLAVARERWAIEFRLSQGREPSDEEIDGAKLDLAGAMTEGHRRYTARQEVLKGAVAELSGEL